MALSEIIQDPLPAAGIGFGIVDHLLKSQFLLRAALAGLVREPFQLAAIGDLLYQGDLAELRSDVGVLSEPVWRMNDGIFSFNDRTTAVAITRTLRQQLGRAAVILDTRLLAGEGRLPPPQQMPLLVVPACTLRSYAGVQAVAVQDAVKQHLAAGGAVLWVGGHAVPPVAALRARLVEGEDRHFPVVGERMAKSKLRLLGEPEQTWSFVRNPYTPAGWHRPVAPWYLESLPGDAVQTLLELIDDQGRARAVGAVATTESGGRIALLPPYALHPYLLSDADLLPRPEEYQLDSVGKAILQQTLRVLLTAGVDAPQSPAR